MNNYIFEAFGEYKIYIAFFLAILFLQITKHQFLYWTHSKIIPH